MATSHVSSLSMSSVEVESAAGYFKSQCIKLERYVEGVELNKPWAITSLKV